MSDPDLVYQFRDTEDIRERFAEEHKKLLLSYGQPRDRCKEKVLRLWDINVICTVYDIYMKTMSEISKNYEGNILKYEWNFHKL